MEVKTVSKPAVQPAPAPKRSAEVGANPARDNKPKENVAQHVAPAKPKPVVNTQGQVTGQHLNVTA